MREHLKANTMRNRRCDRSFLDSLGSPVGRWKPQCQRLPSAV